MVLSYSLGVASSAGLLAAAFCMAPSAWIFVLLGVGAVGWALGSPSRQAMLPGLVPPELFSNAVAWNSSVFYFASVTGPMVGGLMLGIVRTRMGLACWPSSLVLLCRLVAHRRQSP